MAFIVVQAGAAPIVYPDSDELPPVVNGRRASWIALLFSNLDELVRDVPDILVTRNVVWYPIEGQPDVRIAPDVLVVFGRPKGQRSSYLQWEEGNVPVTVAFEVLSPSSRPPEMADKLAFYEEHGVGEYYAFDPATNRLLAYLRRGDDLRRMRPIAGFVSPRLGIRFDWCDGEMVVVAPTRARCVR